MRQIPGVWARPYPRIKFACLGVYICAVGAGKPAVLKTNMLPTVQGIVVDISHLALAFWAPVKSTLDVAMAWIWSVLNVCMVVNDGPHHKADSESQHIYIVQQTDLAATRQRS